MEKEFVPYELALKLRDLGFNEECFGRYTKGWVGDGDLQFYTGCGYKFDVKDYCTNCIAPLWQQAFDFFREEFNLYCVITSSTMMLDWTYAIFKPIEYNPIHNPALDDWSFEEARYKCLDKLIEITENNIKKHL